MFLDEEEDAGTCSFLWNIGPDKVTEKRIINGGGGHIHTIREIRAVFCVFPFFFFCTVA